MFDDGAGEGNDYVNREKGVVISPPQSEGSLASSIFAGIPPPYPPLGAASMRASFAAWLSALLCVGVLFSPGASGDGTAGCVFGSASTLGNSGCECRGETDFFPLSLTECALLRGDTRPTWVHVNSVFGS